MKDLKLLLETYITTIDDIFKSFGIENGYGEILSSIDVKWHCNLDEVMWIENGSLYSNEIRSDKFIYQNYVMFKVDNGCGEQYYQIFNNDLRDEKVQDYE